MGVVGEPATVERFGDMVGNRCAGEMTQRSSDAPVGSDERKRDPASTAGRLERRDGAGGDDVHRFGKTDPRRRDEGAGGISVLDDGEGRVREQAERNSGHPQQPSER